MELITSIILVPVNMCRLGFFNICELCTELDSINIAWSISFFPGILFKDSKLLTRIDYASRDVFIFSPIPFLSYPV